MLTTTQAIVLSVVRQNDRSSILHAYTRACGRASFILYGHRAKPEPLSIVELSYDYLPTRDIQTIKSIALSNTPALREVEECPEWSFRRDMVPLGGEGSPSRQCVSIFVAEILLSVFRHPLEDEYMFRFLCATVEDIRTCADPQNAHLRFLLGLSENLGYGEPDISTPASRQERQSALRELLAHFVTHCEGFVMPRSLDILTEIFD